MIEYGILPTVLNMSGSSQFVSCLIALTSWAKLHSPTGQNLILSFSHLCVGEAYFFDDVSSDDPKSRKIVVFIFPQIARATAIKCLKNTL